MEKKKEEIQQEESETLFIRNIGYETTNEKFKTFMEKFGPVKYAVLVKAHQHNKEDDGDKQ